MHIIHKKDPAAVSLGRKGGKANTEAQRIARIQNLKASRRKKAKE